MFVKFSVKLIKATVITKLMLRGKETAMIILAGRRKENSNLVWAPGISIIIPSSWQPSIIRFPHPQKTLNRNNVRICCSRERSVIHAVPGNMLT